MTRRLLLSLVLAAALVLPGARASAQIGGLPIPDIPADRDEPRFDGGDLLNQSLPGPGFCILGFFCDLNPFNAPAVSFGYKLAAWIFGFLGFVMVLILIYGGFLMLTSVGDAKQYETGKKAIVAAIVGFILLTFCYAAVRTLIKITA